MGKAWESFLKAEMAASGGQGVPDIAMCWVFGRLVLQGDKKLHAQSNKGESGTTIF